ncbi:MAG: hypothetical protein RL077_3393 [Verrucomicrobiota bacterium]
MSPESEYVGPNVRNLRGAPQPLQPMERVTCAHVGFLLVGTTWAFGGQSDNAQLVISIWASLSLVITLAAQRRKLPSADDRRGPIRWLLPVIAFNAFVLLGCNNASFREVISDGSILLIHQGAKSSLPSSARPQLGLQALWLFDGLWLSCFNIALVIRQRRTLRHLLLLAVANAALLAIFGTVQKLGHATGIYFDAVPTSQSYFFASFVYHNHWGSFILLMLAAGIGLTWHYRHRSDARDFFHTPAFAGLVVILLLAITLPLSGSRSTTMLASLFLLVALAHALSRFIRARRQSQESIFLPIIGIGAALIIAGGSTWFVAKDVVVARFSKSQEQFVEMQAIGGIGDRALLYHNTWRMAQEKPWFGWGMASFPHVFTLFNTRESRADRLPVFYHDAHNDWLQALAEHGFAGTTLLVLCALTPLWQLRRSLIRNRFTLYLLGSCLLLLFYAMMEFPFGNVAVVLSWWFCFFCAVHYARLHDAGASPRQLEDPPAVTADA